MRKVIALKLTDKEERIISRLNQEGISNSELIRDALWHYFRTVNQPVNYEVNPVTEKKVNPKVNQINQEINQPSIEKNNEIFYDYVFRLKNEVNQLREESNKLQKDFQEETKNIRKLFDESISVVNLTKKEESLRNKNDFFDVHNAIDEFLRKKENKIRF